jgi:hypothetical protein
MAVAPWVARGTLTATLTTTLYTVTNPAKVIVTNILLCNTSASPATVTIDLDSVAVVSGTTIPAYSTVAFDVKVPIITSGSNLLIRGGSGTASVITYHIAGVSY